VVPDGHKHRIKEGEDGKRERESCVRVPVVGHISKQMVRDTPPPLKLSHPGSAALL